ncbi:helix-turn-helix transcriptional regulator [Micrococcus luteus]|nr:helix-turn-helix transcriptional regulator [Micrococcus luteus]
MNIEEVIGTNLRRVREGRGQSQTEFGAALGEVLGSTWKPQTVSAAEKGRRQFVAADLVALAHALGVPVPTLLTPPSDVTTVTAGTVEVPASALTLLPFSDGETVDPRFLEWSFRGWRWAGSGLTKPRRTPAPPWTASTRRRSSSGGGSKR